MDKCGDSCYRIISYEINKFFVKKERIIIKIFKYYYTQIRWDTRYSNYKLLYICEMRFCDMYYYKNITKPIHEKKLIILKNYFALQKYQNSV